MNFISLETYLGNWRFSALIITFRFLQDDHPFVLGAIMANNSCPLPFQAYIKWFVTFYFQSFKLPLAPFEQLLERKEIIFRRTS
jgi:hypothetical protein